VSFSLGRQATRTLINPNGKEASLTLILRTRQIMKVVDIYASAVPGHTYQFKEHLSLTDQAKFFDLR